jgi:hypothetical protein
MENVRIRVTKVRAPKKLKRSEMKRPEKLEAEKACWEAKNKATTTI